MAVALPLFTSGQISFVGVSLPKITTGELTFVGVSMPKFLSGEGIPSAYIVTPAGGVLVGGRSNIVGDPDLVPSGGVLVGGAATVTVIQLVTSYMYPLGGVLVGGAAANSFSWIKFIPSGGALVGGAATISFITNAPVVGLGGVLVGGAATVTGRISTSYNIGALDEIPSGGVQVGGAAAIFDFIPIIPSGGVLVGGNAAVLERIPFLPSGGVLVGGISDVASTLSFAPSGGVLLAGSAAVTVVYIVAPYGGVAVGGAATINDFQAWFAPSGGVIIGGSATNYMLPSGVILTAENPYNIQYGVWAFNFDTVAPSRYTDLPANSITTFAGKTYIANAGGVYALDAGDDMGRPVNAHFTLPKYDFNRSEEKKVPTVYMSATTGAKFRLRVNVNKLSPLYYAFNEARAKAGAVRGMRATTGKGLQGRFWQFRFENINGADFETDSVELNPEILSRRGA